MIRARTVSDTHHVQMPTRPFIAVQCSCGRTISGKDTWVAWEKQLARHMKSNYKGERTDYDVEVLNVSANGRTLTIEWCYVHGRTRFSVKTNLKRSRRCLACDQENQKRRKERYAEMKMER